MATRGYNNYRGRTSTGRKLLTVGLLLVLIVALVFLFCENYLVYDSTGKVHLELPFTREKEPESAVTPDGVELTREEPKRPHVEELHARELAFDRLGQGVDDLMNEEALVIPVKNRAGDLSYAVSVSLPEGVSAGSGEALEHLKTLLAGQSYTVARIACFADNAYARADGDSALWRDGGSSLWRDESGERWLDPGKESTQTYLTALCSECAQLGFDEILLDYFTYPTAGGLNRITYAEDLDKTAVLGELAAQLREALPRTVALGIVVRTDVTADGGDSGLTPQILCDSFDRIYADTGTVDAAALTDLLTETGGDYVVPGRVVPMVRQAPESGSYLLVQ